MNVEQGTIMSRKKKKKINENTGNFSKALKDEDGNKVSNVSPGSQVSSSLNTSIASTAMAALRGEDDSSMKLAGVSSSSSAAAGVSSKIKLKDIIRRQMNTIRAISAFKGINPTKIYQHLQRIISKIPDIEQRLDVEDVASLLTEQGEKEAAAFAAWDEMFSDPEAQIELLSYTPMTVPIPIDINGKYIKPVIAEGWEQGDVVKNNNGIWEPEPEFYRIDETGEEILDEKGERIKWDKKAGLGDIPYFNIPEFLAGKVFAEPKYVSVGFLAHGQYYGLKYPLFCLNRGCLAGGPMVEYNPVAVIGNANFSGPIKDTLFFNGLRDGETLVELAKGIFQTIRHYSQYKNDPDVQINTNRIEQQTVTSNRYLPNKLLSFNEDITQDKYIPNEHATRFNHGVYIGKNDKGLPEGTKIDISELIKDSDGDVTLEVLVKYLIARFNLKEGDTLEINDTSCAVLMYDARGKNARTNRRGARSLQNIIAEIKADKDPIAIYRGIAADKTSNFAEYLEGVSEPERDQRLQSYNQEIMDEFEHYIATAAGGGRLRKNVITKKLKSGVLKNARTRKPNRRLKRNTRKMHNKSRKRRTRRSKR